MATANTRLENQILHFSKLKKWDKVENLWPQFIEEPSTKPKFYATLATLMVKNEKSDELRSWFMLLIESCQGQSNHRALIQASRGTLVALPEIDDLRQPLIAALKTRYAKNARTDEYIDASGLASEEKLNQPLKNFLQYIKCSKGEVFQHVEWGEAVVENLDLEAGRVEFDFTRGGKKSFSFAGVREYLKKIPRAHLFAQRLLNPERLLKQANEEPVEFIKFCLKSLGGAAARAELKEHLTIGLFDARKWNSWWGKNRDALRFDPYISFSGTPGNAQLALRDKPKSFHEEMLKEFLQADGFSREYNILTDLLKMQKTEPIPEENAKQFIAGLETKFQSYGPEDIARKMEYLYLLSDVKETVNLPSTVLQENDAVALLRASHAPVESICDLSVAENQMRAACELKASRPDDWAEFAEEFFLSAPMRLGQWVLRDMIEENKIEDASHIAEQLLHRPYENPDLFLWVVRAIRDGKLPSLNVDISPEALFSAVIELIEDSHKRVSLDDIESTSLRTVINRFQTLLMDNHYAIVTKVFEDYETEDAQARYKTLMDSQALAEGFKVALDQILRALRRDLDAEGAESETAEHFVTAESFKARQAEYMQIKNDDIPENSKAIGTAAAMGDLSENAEYDAAKERQKILFRRLESLEDLLQRARVLEPDQITTETIGFGTAFQIKNMDSGEIEDYTLLGLWDANPDKNILSYVTPFGKQFLKRKVGDVLVVLRPGGGSTQYKVLEISNALTKA